ncbi:hypothetical protein IM288_18250 [Enterobacter cloacae complex sp. P32C]|uniref:hypothetical protein n=1 Tax=Enterobacter cloacae complex sp. P32C TaxID=2779559 RepID=UPI0018680CBD|nr:hypothetical protein [Enterobacter cloacae complex sp. P32C]MBE3210411.1 hypothetical protein [Enterobacter cloacae complex sp. P32C]
MAFDWRKFKKLRTLDIKYSKYIENGAYIYNNGKNCIAVTLTCEILDKNNKLMELTESDLQHMVYLCKYRNGEEISPPFKYLVWGNEFEGAVKVENVYSIDTQSSGEVESVAEKKINTMTFYIYCDPKPSNASEIISAGVNITGIGKFDTSQTGTNTPNAPSGEAGSVFKAPKYVVLNSIPLIDYSLISNLSIKGGWSGYKDMNLVSNNLDCSVLDSDGRSLLGVKKKGQMYRAELKISTPENLSNHYLKIKKITRNDVKIEGLDLAGHSSRQYADIIYGYNTRNPAEEMPVQVYDTSILFIDAKNYGIKKVNNRGVPIKGVNNQGRPYYIKLAPEVATYNTAVVDSSLSLSVIHLRHCAYFYSGEEWSSYHTSNNLSKIEITDNFGNGGKLNISFSKNKDNPGGVLINNSPVA